MSRRLAPVATPITFKEYLISGPNIFSGNHEIIRSFEAFFSKQVGVKHSFAVSSGRTGLYAILKTLERISGKKEVIIPAYTCPSVAAAIVRAGLKVVLCDISNSCFSYDLGQFSRLINEDTLAVVCVHLFGIPVETEKVFKMAREKGAYLIEDMAQSLKEANSGNSPIKGGLAFYSLGRGKNITACGGGIIATDDDNLAKEIAVTLQECRKMGIGDSLVAFLKLTFYFIFINPTVYFIPERLTFLNLGETIYSTDFDIGALLPLQSALGNLMLRKINKVNDERIRKALLLHERLRDFKGIDFIDNTNGDALYLRFPFFIKNETKREEIYSQLRRRGLGVTRMYPEPLDRISPLSSQLNRREKYPNAEAVSKRILTLPTHYGVTEDDIDRMARVIGEEMGKDYPNEN